MSPHAFDLSIWRPTCFSFFIPWFWINWHLIIMIFFLPYKDHRNVMKCYVLYNLFICTLPFHYISQNVFILKQSSFTSNSLASLGIFSHEVFTLHEVGNENFTMKCFKTIKHGVQFTSSYLQTQINKKHTINIIINKIHK